MNIKNTIDTRATFLKSLVQRAADCALESYNNRSAGDYSLKGPQDYLTETDLAVENLIRDEISRAFPEDAILGEETGGEPNEMTWIIDPIDGTENFARGTPHFCVIIAFCLNGRAVLSAIAQPVLKTIYFAHQGKGAYKNDQPIHTSKTASLNQASLEFGWSRNITIDEHLSVQRYLLEQGASIHRRGSGGLALVWVAEGWSDAYLELSMNSWDCVAGMLLVEEAGGRVGHWPNSVADLAKKGPVIASSPLIANAIEGINYPNMKLKDSL
ncbi:inositol monophosphatase [Marinomonas mediterranea]|uniref:inositol monophosphatase family protein n=1 Tax=Marinomonas mediterranea TaxID=119864 RepID=UPI00234BAFEC|nr:inositol monophosphatase family protein [Marinomonas mediterranea]WCN12742.1 inositol monophosphatase [Marinomonas mediterranea]